MSVIKPEDAPSERPLNEGELRWERAAILFGDWRSGNPRAMEELVRLMTPVLWHVVRAYGLSPSLTEDVIQTTWLRLVLAREAIVEDRSVAAWLTTTARREGWRAGRADRRMDATELDHLEPLLPPPPTPEDHAALTEEAHRLWTAVSSLTDRCQRLLRVIAFDDRPDYARLASELTMPIGSIGPTRQRCLAKLRAVLSLSDPRLETS